MSKISKSKNFIKIEKLKMPLFIIINSVDWQ